MKKLKVLYIHHKGNFGGSSKSLLNMIQAFPPDSIDPYLICPGRGEVADVFEKNGVKICRTIGVSIFDQGFGGYYRGMRWMIILRELFYLFPTFWALQKSHKKWGSFDLVHINEIVMLLPAIIEKMLWKTPIVMHVRSTQQRMKGKIRIFAIEKVINYFVNEVIAISKKVSITLKNIKNVNIIYNGTIFGARKDIGYKEKINFYKLYNIPYNNIIVSMIGQLQKDKGVFDFVEAAKICLRRHNNITFLLIGKNAYSKKEIYSFKGKIQKKLGFLHDCESELHDKVKKYGINSNVIFTGFMLDVDICYRLTDILCFLVHDEAVGRPPFEAAMHKVPSIVALTKPDNDIVIDNYTGICVPPHSPEILANQILKLANNKKLRTKLGKNARKHCEKLFDIKQISIKVLELYERMLMYSNTKKIYKFIVK